MQVKLIITGFLAAFLAPGQTKIDLSSQTAKMDFSNASFTKPFRSGSQLPTSCSAGETFSLLAQVRLYLRPTDIPARC